MTLPAELAAFDAEWKTGDRAAAKQMAIDYVAANRARLGALLGGLSREDLVALVSMFRAAGREADRVGVDMWLLSEFAPVGVTGAVAINAGDVLAQVEALLNGGGD